MQSMKEKERKIELRVPSTIAEVHEASSKILDFLKPLGLNESAAFDVRLCLEEALINAVKHGNRLNEKLHVKVIVQYDEHELNITIEDEGPGFDPGKVEDCTLEENLLESRGRGVFLMHKLMDSVAYNSNGNGLTMTKRLGAAKAGQV